VLDDERLPDDLMKALSAHGNTRAYKAGAILIHEGDLGDALFILIDGRLRVYGSSEDGREVVLSEHGPGSFVGELSLDGQPRSASVRTLVPSTCCVVPGAQLRAFMADHP
jgi:CRP/FNR family cyclic AMP-dependent transcriptional regulator